MRAVVAQWGVGDDAAQLVLPNVSMNLSGQVVSPLLKYFGLGADRLLVVHDDIDLPFAKLRVQFDRSAGGNNGVESIIRSLGSGSFWRLKLGVGRPPGRIDPAAFVLRRFRSGERPDVDVMIERAVEAAEVFLELGGDAARQRAGDLNVGDS